MLLFEDLLKPLSIAEFLATSWDKSYHHISASSPSKLDALPGLAQFPKLFCGELGEKFWDSEPYSGIVQAGWIDARGNMRRLNVAPAQSADLYNAGAALCFAPVESRHSSLAELVQDALGRTGFKEVGTVGTTAYLTPPHSGGPMHFDPQHVFFCQVSGEKHWKVSTAPAMTRPPVNVEAASLDDHTLNLLAEFGWSLTLPSDATFVDILLKQGDVLYLPPGIWHESRTDETHSLHYTLTFYTISTWGVLFASLRAVMMKHPEWRRDLRFLDATGSDSEEVVVNRMLTTLRQELDRMTARDLLATYRATEGFPPGFRLLFRTP